MEGDNTGKRRRRALSLRAGLLLMIFLCWVLPVFATIAVSGVLSADSTRRHVADILSGSVHSAMDNVRGNMNNAVGLAVNVSYNDTIRTAYAQYLKDGDKLVFVDSCIKYLNSHYVRNEVVAATYLLIPRLAEAGGGAPSESDYIFSFNPAGKYSDVKQFYTNGAAQRALEMMDELDTSIGFLQADGRLYLVRNLSLLQNRLSPYAMLVSEIDQDALLGGLRNLPGVQDATLELNGISVVALGDIGDPAPYRPADGTTVQQVLAGDRLWVSGSIVEDRYQMDYYVLADMRPFVEQMGGPAGMVAVVALVAGVLLGVVLYFFLRRVDRPIARLSALAGEIEAGSLGAQTDVDRLGSAEFVYLGNQMNAMSARLQEQFERLYREELALRDARIKALQSQINPHFLGNTLEIINWEARLSGNVKISQMLEALSTILRATQARDQKPYVHLSEEMMYVRSYLFISKQRLGKRMEMRQELDESLLDWYVPRLILQPIVENAVEHGIGARQRGVLTIRTVRVDDEWMRLEVENDAPLSKTDEERIARLLDEEEKPGETSLNIGIRNVHARLRMLYGEQSGLIIKTDKNGHTVSSMCIQNRAEAQENAT